MIVTNCCHDRKETSQWNEHIYWHIAKNSYAFYACISHCHCPLCSLFVERSLYLGWGGHKKVFLLSFELIKATKRKILWVSFVEDKLTKKVVVVLLSTSFLDLNLKYVSQEDLGFCFCSRILAANMTWRCSQCWKPSTFVWTYVQPPWPYSQYILNYLN